MSTTAAPSVVAEVEQWLSRFDEALTQGDSAAAAELFGQDSYWRDLVAFTWNITTVEGQAGVAAHARAHPCAHPAARLADDGGAGCRERRERGVDRV